MARLRFVAVALLALAFAGSSTYTGRTQAVPSDGTPTTKPKPAADDSCVIYSLTDMGLDAPLGDWIRENVLEVIEPGSWKGQGGFGLIRYYAPKNILLVNTTNGIQKKVEGFLKDLKASMPKASITSFATKKTSHASVVPADYREPAILHTSTPASEPTSYPVPAAVKPPKHLFHFIIRYEGDGIIDDNVVKFMKAQLQGAKSPVSVVPGVGGYEPGTPPPTPAGSVTPQSSSYAAPSPAVQYGGSAPSAAPTLRDGSPAPYTAPASPVPAPKKKKGKKDDHKEATTLVPAYAR